MLFLIFVTRWKGQSMSSHAQHKNQVAHRGMLQAVLHSTSVENTTVKEKNVKITESKDAEKTREEDTEDIDKKDQETLVVEKKVEEGVASSGEGHSVRVRGLKCSSIEEYAAAAADTLQGIIVEELQPVFQSHFMNH